MAPDRGNRNPIYDLELRLQDLTTRVNLRDDAIRETIGGMKEDIDEIKDDQKNYVRSEKFAWFEKFFWVIATAVVSIMGSLIFFFLTSKG